MLWRGRRGSGNIEDRRGMGAGGLAAGGGIIGVIIYFLNAFLGGDPGQLPQLNPNRSSQLTAEQQAAEDTMANFISVVLAETEDVWTEVFRKTGKQYEKPSLVMFRDLVQSGCGNASSASGPFYCPADGKVYIDLSFYGELKDRFHASGDFAMAYVVAHEVGHHVQNLLGISEKVSRLRQQLSESEYNRYSVMLELQADYLAGVWAHYVEQEKQILEPGDIDEAMTAAASVGDDRIQKQSQGYIVPDAFTHGTSAQRQQWFNRGYKFGDLEHGNTFGEEISLLSR